LFFADESLHNPWRLDSAPERGRNTILPDEPDKRET
jgi:hypothetical protein